jgi:hypothetical protein
MNPDCCWSGCRRSAPKGTTGWRSWYDEVDQEECHACPEHDLKAMQPQIEIWPAGACP